LNKTTILDSGFIYFPSSTAKYLKFPLRQNVIGK